MPIRSIDDLRKQVGPDWNDVSDEDLISSYAKSIEANPAAVAYQLGFGLEEGGKNSKRLSSSIDRYQAGLYGVGEELTKAVGLDSASNWLGKQRRSNELRADTDALRAQELGAIDSYKQVHDFSSGVDYATGLGIQSLPYAAEALAGGLLTRGLMSGTRAALTAAEAAKDTAAAAKAKRALDIGSTAGRTAASYPSAVGDILSNQREQNGTTDLLSAGALAVPYAVANATLGVDSALAKGNLFRNSVDILDNVKGFKGGVARAAATGAVTGLKEGASETFQEGMNQLGRMAVDPKAEFLDPDAVDRYKESFIGGAILGGGTSAALGGWRKSGNDIEQTFQSTSTGTTPANTAEQLTPPAAPPSAPAAAAVPPAAPIVQGGTTEVAQASQAAQNEQAQADVKLQEQANREQAFQTVGATITPDNGGELTVFGQKVFGPQISAFGNALAGKINALPEHGTQIANAIAQAHTETGNKLVSFQYNGGNPVGSADKLVKAITKVADKFQIAHVESVEQAADILNKQSETAKGDKLEQINAIHVALTGQDTAGFLEANNQPAKGAQDGQLQVQTPAGVGSVPAQGSAASATDDVGSGGLRAVGPAADGQAAPDLQADPGTASLLRADTPATAGGGSGTAAGQAPQVIGAVDGQQAPATQAAGASQAAPAGQAVEQDAAQPGDGGNRADVPQGDRAEAEQDVTDQAGTLLRNVLGMIFKSQAKIEFLATFVRKQNDVTYEELGKRLGLSKNTIKQYQKLLRVDEATGLPQFIAENLDKFQQALKIQAELMGIDVAQMRATLDAIVAQEEEAATVADEGDLINQGYAIQSLKERTDSEGKGTGKVDRTNVSDLNEEGNKAEALNNRYLQLMDQLDEAESNGDEDAAEKLRDELAAVAVLAAEADKRARAQVASQAGKKPQTSAQKDSDPEAADDEDTTPASKRAAAKKAEPKQEAKPEPQEMKSDDQRAGEAWDAVAGEYPNAPKWADLTKAQRDTFVEYGEENWTPDDVRSELIKLAKAEKVAYPPKAQAGAPAYLESAQRAVVDFMNGEITKDELIQKFVDLKMTNGQVRSVTDRISDDKYGWLVSDREEVERRQQGAQQSRAEPAAETYTVEDLQDSLRDFVGRDSLGETVTVVDSLEDLRDAGEFADMTDAEFAKYLKDNEIDGSTQAFVSNATSRVYMLASNIQVGTGRGVFMHEVGGHLGLQKQLPQELFKRLANQVVAWAKKDDGSIESQLAQAAVERVVDAGQAATTGRYNELVAYFLEEAVNSGINPKAYENLTPGLREWLRSLWAAFKNALRKLRGVNVDKLTANDVVDMAYGYAQLALAGRFHGSNAKFKRFSVAYMGTGAGNQQYGWGAYFAQRRKTAEGYSVPETDMPEGTESHLYHVDLAIRDHEWLHWSKPLAQQSALVRKIATKMGLRLTDDGGDLYNHIAEKLFEQKFKRNPDGAEARKAHRMASEMLNTLGVKGIQYRDANDSSRKSNNLVVFNDKDIIRVQTESGLALDRQALEPDFEWAGVQQSRAAIARLPKPLQAPVEGTWKALFKNALLPVAITEDVVKMASKYMKSAERYLQAQYARQKARLGIESRVEKILDRFDKLTPELQKLVNEYIYDSTMQQKWGYYPGAHRVGTTLFEVDPDFEKRFDAISTKSAEAAKIIEDTFEHGFQILQLKQAAVDAAIDREFKAREDAAMGDPAELKKIADEKRLMKKRELAIRNIQVDKPYAYLGRHGDYVVVAKSKEFIAAEEIAKGESSSVAGDSVFGDPQQAKNWLQENVSNPEHYVVQFAETQSEADKVAAELIATGKYDVQPEDAGVKEANASYGGGDAFLAVKRLRNLADRQGEVDPHLEKLLGDLYLATVAEASARKSELQRKYVAGADKNMMRNLATSGRADAHFLSTMLHNDEIVDSLEAMRNEARGNRRDAMPIYNELFSRYTKGLEYRDAAPLVRAATQFSTAYYLSTSPAFYLQQILQTSVLSLPFMSGRLGYFRSVRAINGAYKDVAKLVKGLSMTDHIDFSKAPADVKAMLETLVGMGKIDVGIDADAKARSGEQGVMSKVMRKLQGLNTRVESINRATAAIAAYRGYLQRYGAGQTAEATRFAAEVVSNTHGSYDGFNTPRVLNNDFGRFFLQFKRFQIIQLSMLGKLLHNTFKGASTEERLVARKTLGFITAHMAVLGGALGVPFVSQLGQALLSAFGDDDEPANLEYQLRKLIDDDTVADLLLRGVPGAVGLESLGKKLAMENVASILPFTDVDLTSRSGMEKVLVGLMGPTSAIGLKYADAFGLIGKGELYKGMEQMLPTGFANVAKGLRFATDGITMRNGDTVMSAEDISILDAAFQAVGLPTSTITERQRTQQVIAEFDKFYQDRSSEIKSDYAKAFKSGDSSAMQDAREAWMELQDSRMRNGYTRQPLSNLFRAPMEQLKRERNVAGGVEFTKNNRLFVERVANQ
jgi:hypothetical protein